MPKRIAIRQSWGLAACHLTIDGVEIRVDTPFIKSPDRGKQYEFLLPDFGVVEIAIYEPPIFSISVDGKPVATITPVTSLTRQEFGQKPYPLEVANISFNAEDWPLIGTVYCGIAMMRHRVLSRQGSRVCYWKKGGCGTWHATLLVSDRVDPQFIPIAMSAAILNLMLD